MDTIMEPFGFGYIISSFLLSIAGTCLGAGLPISVAIIIAAYILKKKG